MSEQEKTQGGAGLHREVAEIAHASFDYPPLTFFVRFSTAATVSNITVTNQAPGPCGNARSFLHQMKNLRPLD